MTTSEQYMLRALELAALGRGSVSPNPMVGCVIVHEHPINGNRIIGEGWHQQYGSWHAEVNAVRSVSAADEALLPESTVYVTLEPCSHVGKTPPCADLLIDKRVKRVVCCNNDPNPLVAGKGFQKLREAGIEVITGVLQQQGLLLNARFFTYIESAIAKTPRPYVILKWAETTDGYLAAPNFKAVQITGPLSQRLVHRWRTEEDAIMVGTNTARYDNPRLNARLWPGKNPVRVVIDKTRSLPESLHLFDDTQPTLVYTLAQNADMGIPLDPQRPLLPQLLADLHNRKIQSVLVEGGTTLLESIMEAGLWDEMRVFRSPKMLHEGIRAPSLRGTLINKENVGDDELLTLLSHPHALDAQIGV